MNKNLSPHDRSELIREFQQRTCREDAENLIDQLNAGLDLLRNLLFERIHTDVEENVGKDSILLPVSPIATQQKTEMEIEIYQIAETEAYVRDNSLVAPNDEQWLLPWLSRFRVGEVLSDPQYVRQMAIYKGKAPEKRRLAFSMALERTFPEARRAPLVIYRLFPLAVAVNTAVAFGEHSAAREVRKSQVSILGSILDCRQCHGDVLDSGEMCRQCGNPLWKYQWLTAE